MKSIFIRLIASSALAVCAFGVAAIAVGTATLRYCPANSLLGVDTCPKAA